MNRTLNFLSILGLIGLCIKMSIDQQLSAELVAVVLVGAVFVFSREDWLSAVLKITISLFSIAYLLVGYAYSRKEFLALSAYLGALVLALFGFFVMFGGLRKKNNEIHLSINSKTGKVKRKWFRVTQHLK